MHSNKQNPKEFIGTGDIGAGVGFKDIRTGDTLCDEAHPIVLEAMDFPDPVIGIAIEPKTQKDLDKLPPDWLSCRKKIRPLPLRPMMKQGKR
jgi:Translation elongation factors (GTPases)